ncbi:hypothetical protein [Leptolyngbya sp. FACHB-17]|uniref:hypothetical protein n=1 Tax=unclassified Leptolyngbya TaxID=2650499 RepID=UPI001680B02E|nr:hypothetical protein [Leptolyngbya sp. FACHB-17]MBD2081845.1 hypothetical protein [Leptolyngbya sp. FACHB-17]
MKRIALIAGFESFNAGLYRQAAVGSGAVSGVRCAGVLAIVLDSIAKWKMLKC